MSDGTPFVSKVVGQGKMTIPKNIRDLFSVKDGDLVLCVFVKVERGNESPSESPEPSRPQTNDVV